MSTSTENSSTARNETGPQEPPGNESAGNAQTPGNPDLQASATSAAPPAEELSGAKRGLRALGNFFSMRNRFLAPILITTILVMGQLAFGVLESLSAITAAIGTAIVVELVLGKWMTGKWPNLASAYISGISVGILIRSPYVWPYMLCAALSIMSKYVLRWRGRHLWNPSNFGVSAMMFLYSGFAATLSFQFGNNLPAMIVVWGLGSIIIMRLKRFHICATYVLSFLFFAWVSSKMGDDAFIYLVAPLTGPMYQLYIFFMITDPRTTVRSKWGQCLVVFLVALVEMILRLNDVVHAPYFSLFIVGPIALALSIYWNDRKKALAAQQSPQPATHPSPATPAAV